MSSNTLLPPHWRHLLYHFLKPVERETETTIKTKSKYSLCTTSDRSVAGRGINKAVDLVTMLRFVLSLFLLWRTEFGLKLNGYIDDSLTRCFGYYWRSRIGYWVFAHTKPAIQWFAWVTSKQKIPHAKCPKQPQLNKLYMKKKFFPMSSRLQFSFEYISHCHMGLSTLPWRMIYWKKGKVLDSDSGLYTFLGLGRIFAA